MDGVNEPNIYISGANVHIVSGSGSTYDGGQSLGRGNLIIGYNEDPHNYFSDPGLQPGDRGGSHNLVVGPGNRFTHSAFGGAVIGWNNTINGINASVYGGLINRADQGTILGGTNNIASANAATISGGDRHTASGDRVSILGGENNTASAPFANIVGGSNNTASGQYWIIPNPLPGYIPVITLNIKNRIPGVVKRYAPGILRFKT